MTAAADTPEPMAGHLLLLALGALLLLLAVPRVVSNYHLAVGESAYELVAEGAPMARASLERARRSREAALAVLETGAATKQLGHILLRDALVRPWSDPERAPLLEQAVARLRRGLALEPADLFAWYHLALAEWWRGRLGDAASALAMSYRTGPYHPPLAGERGRLALALWPHLTPAARTAVVREVCLLPPRRLKVLRDFAESSARTQAFDEIVYSWECYSTRTSKDDREPP